MLRKNNNSKKRQKRFRFEETISTVRDDGDRSSGGRSRFPSFRFERCASEVTVQHSHAVILYLAEGKRDKWHLEQRQRHLYLEQRERTARDNRNTRGDPRIARPRFKIKYIPTRPI